MNNIIDGKRISNEIFAELKSKVFDLSQKAEKICIVDIQVGDEQSSTIYVNNKKKKFDEVGIKFIHKQFPNNITEYELIKYIQSLNIDKSIDAIFVELPLPHGIDESKVINTIDYKKDVDGFNIKNVGALSSNIEGFYPCTAESVIELLKRSDIELCGKHAVVLGRSNVIGKPVAQMLINEDATVTICHSKTTNLKSICNTADILIVAIGKKKFIDDTYIKDKAVVIDVGIHREIIDGKNIICGDVDFEKAYSKCSYITPVPGGVGPMTIMMLISHCIKAKMNG